MSFDATRSAWAARDAGAIEGGPRLLVALALADMTYQATGEAVAGTRGLSARCGVGLSTTTAALRELEVGGVIERTERGQGSRPSRWRWVLAPPPPPPPTGSAQGVDNLGPRTATGTPARAAENANGSRRTATGTPAFPYGNNYQDQEISRVCDPAEVPERVAELRERMGGRSRQARHLGPPLAPTPEHYAADDDGRPFDMTKPEHYGEAAR